MQMTRSEMMTEFLYGCRLGLIFGGWLVALLLVLP